jgi:transcriptional regulator with XRE-family HTH domain
LIQNILFSLYNSIGGAAMSIQSLKHRIQKRMNHKNQKQEYADRGRVSKKKRKELNVTQDEISNGICSISYLSKIENNQIVPSDMYVREIMEKLDIDHDMVSKGIQDKVYVTDIIDAFFYYDDEKMERIYQDIKDIEYNVVINLCKLGYTVYHQLEDDNQYVMMLEHVVNNMSDLEVELYLYFASLYFIFHQKYKVALELIVLYESMTSMDPKLDGMFKELAFHVKHRLHLKVCASDDYHHAMTIYQHHHNVSRIVRLAMEKICQIATEHPQKALTMMDTLKVSLLKQEELDSIHYHKATIFYQLEQYQDATFALKHIDRDSVYYYRKMILLLKICIQEDDQDMIVQIQELLEDISPDRREMNAKIQYHYLLQQSQEDKKEFLRDIAIPFSIKVEDYSGLYQYTMDIMNLCMEHSRYKEATQYFHKYEKEVAKIEKLLY